MPRVKGASPPTSSPATRERLLEATRWLLATRGFAATTTRAIGAAAECNPALVAYHYGSLNALLLAVLDASSQQRMARYREELARAGSLAELRRMVAALYREDRDAGHATVLAELVAGGLMDRDLGLQVVERVQPWVDFAEEAIRGVVPTQALRRRARVKELAYAVVALFLGLEVLGQLAGEHRRDEAVVYALTAKRAFWGGDEPEATGQP